MARGGGHPHSGEAAVRSDFKQLHRDDCRVVLVDLVDRVLPTMDVAFSEAAAEHLRTLGVELRLGARVSGISAGCSLDRGGRVIVNDDFTIPEHLEIRVVGDLCCYLHTPDGRPLADLRGLHLTGLAGWIVWALAHLAFIPDTENRIALFSKWMWQIATRQRTALLITGRPDQHIGVDVGLLRAERSA